MAGSHPEDRMYSDLNQLIFVDSGVTDADVLMSGLRPGVRVEDLPATDDPIAVIALHLAGARDLSALHILSHGEPGALQLSGRRVDLAAFAARPHLLNAIRDAGTKDLTFASNNAGVDDFGIGILLQTKQVKKMISSYVGENKEFMRQYLGGELELEFNPQGTLAERMRAGGAGIPGFYTKTGVGTVIAEGKEHKDFDGETYILERGIVADLAIVKAWKADDTGNLVFRKTARNFNPPAAMCGKICIAEVEEIVPRGSLGGDAIHLPGIYVHRIIQGDHEKRIEQRTVRTA